MKTKIEVKKSAAFCKMSLFYKTHHKRNVIIIPVAHNESETTVAIGFCSPAGNKQCTGSGIGVY
jgi:hypothetical protein